MDGVNGPSSASGGVRLVRWSLDIEASFDAPETFMGTASDAQGFDSGIAAIELSGAGNLQLNLPPEFESGDPVVEYSVTLIDASAPASTGSIGASKRYLSQDLPQPIPDNNPSGVVSSIVVTDTDIVADVDITFNIFHPNATDIEMTMTGPMFIDLFSARGGTGNDFNGDGLVNLLDLEPFVEALLAGDPDCRADLNLDGRADGLDVQPFVDLLTP